MAYPDLRAFLSDLGDDLLHVRQEFDPKFEIAAVLRSLPADAPAVLFENLAGYPGARVAGNLIANRRRMALALGTTEERLAQTWLENKGRALAPVIAKGSAPVQEVVHRSPDALLSLLPILTHHEKDAGPFITTGVVLCTDPATGRRGMGIHRMMVKGGKRLGILLANPPLSQFHANAEAAGRPLEVAIALGLEPATLLASVVRSGPLGPDKMAIAGALRGEPVELVRALTVDVEVPARAEIIIEGRVLPGVRETEGPFGENTGYYFSNVSPVIEVTAVTHRDNFIYPGLCPWSADVDTLLSLAAGTELLGQLQALVAGVVDLELTGGTAGFSATVAVKGCARHEVRRLIMLALNLDRRLKTVTVVDDDVNIRDPREIAWAMATRYLPERDTVIISGAEGYVIDPSSAGSSAGSKAGFVATRGSGPEFDKVTLPAAAAAKAQEFVATMLR
ncbi:UbiD family decarboxylase [Aromatoleum diolicum]|uniref:UbiD family decarboxylase n=1 Tax=Aromatoleum diolicum TaxID=75796 RepID=A0ABX1Q9V3_9RHOO|nr:UbiD family decarboxylase [Aromatoleum diolicum]NMG75157.1 UbiD family decarboxylase [Aromatoleum diolicum]